jgi:hypothetical protein
MPAAWDDVLGPLTAGCLSGVTPEWITTISAAFIAFSVS